MVDDPAKKRRAKAKASARLPDLHIDWIPFHPDFISSHHPPST
jgi:hypothetical protein